MLPDIDWTGLTAEEIAELRDGLNTEIGRRHTIATGDDLVDELNRAVLTGEGRKKGDPWRQPTGAHDAYPKNWEVAHGGKKWDSLIPGNVWEPGVSGWREIAEPGGQPPAWVQPAGAHDAYNVGDLVRFQGKTYRSKIPANVWSPADHPPGWELVP